jgi:hypothetical protein
MLRVLLAGVVGGLLVFFAAFVDRMVFGWTLRTFSRFQDEAAVVEVFRAQDVAPGIYRFPQPPDAKLPEDIRKAEVARMNAAYKEGPAALVVVAPKGEDMMGPRTLLAEALTDVGTALMVAWMVAQAVGSSLFKRWLMCVVFGVASWLSLVASYAIWDRFPASFVHDELFCTTFEWAVAGLAIAVLVKPAPPPSAATPPTQT